jgi:cation-transporting ATPase E
MSSVLYLMKTIFTITLSILSVATRSGYPFDPKQLLFTEMIVIGLASLMLTVEPNFRRSEGSYLETVLKKSIPNAAVMLLPVFLAQIIGKGDSYSSDTVSAVSCLAVTLAAFMNLIFLCRPYTDWRIGVVLTAGALLCIAIPGSMFFLKDMIGLFPAFDSMFLLILILGITLTLSVVVHLGVSLITGMRKKRN